MPEQFGGFGSGITEAALVMHAISASGAGLSGASAAHMNIFGLHPVVVHGSDAQRARWLPPLIRGEDKACFAVTEPNTGLNTLNLMTYKVLLLARTTPVEDVKRNGEGLGRVALKRTSAYAGERVVFGRPIGQNQGIAHPLALLVRTRGRMAHGASRGLALRQRPALRRRGQCGQLLGRVGLIPRIAPVNRELILNFMR